MSVEETVDFGELSEHLMEHVEQGEPLTATSEGRAVGVFIPVPQDSIGEAVAFAQRAEWAAAVVDKLGMTEDDIVAEFEKRRRGDTGSIG